MHASCARLTPPRLCLLAMGLSFSACGPKSTTSRRVVTGTLTADAQPEATERAPLAYSWSSGARHQLERGPSGSPQVTWHIDLGTPLVHDLVVRGERAYTVGDGQVFCVTEDGHQCWASPQDAVGGLTVREAGLAVPTVQESMVDLEFTGEVRETHPTGGVIAGSPVTLAGELVWVTDSGKVEAETGWTVDASDSAVGRPASNAHHVYFGTETGEVIATSRARTVWRAVLPGPVVGGLVATDDRVFAAYRGAPGRPGGVAALLADTGVLVWRMPLSENPAAAPALGHTLVVADQSGEIFAFQPEDGTPAWTAEVVGAPATAPTFGQFGLYIGNADGRLHRFDPDDGGEVWSIQLGATPSTAPVLLSEKVLVGLTDGNLVAVGGR